MPEIIPNWHPLLVHFTIGLLFIGTLFYAASLLLPSERLALQSLFAARWTLVAGVLITIGTVLAGWYAYNTVQHDDPGHAAMTDHRNWALVTASLFAVLVVWDVVRARKGRKAGVGVAAGLLVAAVLLGVTGYKGGEVVFRYGIGVMSLPEVDDHAHSEADQAYGSQAEVGDHPDQSADAGHMDDSPQDVTNHHDNDADSGGMEGAGSAAQTESSVDKPLDQSAGKAGDSGSGAHGHEDDGHSH